MPADSADPWLTRACGRDWLKRQCCFLGPGRPHGRTASPPWPSPHHVDDIQIGAALSVNTETGMGLVGHRSASVHIHVKAGTRGAFAYKSGSCSHLRSWEQSILSRFRSSTTQRRCLDPLYCIALFPGFLASCPSPSMVGGHDGHGERSSSQAPTRFVPGGFITTPRFWKQYNAATPRFSERLDKWVDPLGYETIALFEDLYHHRLFPGEEFSNNSQQPPLNTSRKACDLVTRYWDGDSTRTFLFTEMKRESGDSCEEAEYQLYNYCRAYLESGGSGALVFGAAPRGTRVALFVVTRSDIAQMPRLCDYTDVKDDRGRAILQELYDAAFDAEPVRRVSRGLAPTTRALRRAGETAELISSPGFLSS